MKKTEGQRNATTLYRDLFSLPDRPTVTKTRCIQLTIPDDDQHMAALLGAIQLLAKWNSWARDDGKNGTLAAQTWQRALAGQKIFENCPTKSTLIYEDENPMPIRVDCDCRVFALCCDGTTEVELSTAQMVESAIRGLPHEQATQPRPNGGCETYNKTITGMEHVLIPAPVNSADVITLSNWQGASNNHGNPDWYCGDGGQYFAGKCTAFNHLDGAAYMPAVPVGTLIVNIDGTYYDGRSPITVPGGVSNAQPFVLLNYNPADVLSGTLTFDAEVCNNQAGAWSHTFDLTSIPGPFVADTGGGGPAGHWVAGVGWKPDDVAFGGVPYRLLDIHCTTSISALNKVETIGTYTCGGLTVEHGYEVKTNGTPQQAIVGCLPSGAFDEIIGFADVACTDLDIFSNTCAAGACASGDVTYTKIILSGDGVDPF